MKAETSQLDVNQTSTESLYRVRTFSWHSDRENTRRIRRYSSREIAACTRPPRCRFIYSDLAGEEASYLTMEKRAPLNNKLVHTIDTVRYTVCFGLKFEREYNDTILMKMQNS